MVSRDIAILNLKEFARAKNMRIRFRNTPTNAGDFCIFIYENGKNHYSVGWDGSNNELLYPDMSFNKCVQKAKEWINKH